MRLGKDGKIRDLDFNRYANLPINYESEKSVGKLHTLTVEEAKDIMQFTMPVMRPILQDEQRWLRNQHVDPSEGRRLIANWESGKFQEFITYLPGVSFLGPVFCMSVRLYFHMSVKTSHHPREGGIGELYVTQI